MQVWTYNLDKRVVAQLKKRFQVKCQRVRLNRIKLCSRSGDAVVIYDSSPQARELLQRLHHDHGLAVFPNPRLWRYLDPLYATQELTRLSRFPVERRYFPPGAYRLPNLGDDGLMVKTPHGRQGGLKCAVMMAGTRFESDQPFLVEPYVVFDDYLRVYWFDREGFCIRHRYGAPHLPPREVVDPIPTELVVDVMLIAAATGLPALAVDYLEADAYYAVDIHVLPELPHIREAQWAAGALAAHLADWVQNLTRRP